MTNDIPNQDQPTPAGPPANGPTEPPRNDAPPTRPGPARAAAAPAPGNAPAVAEGVGVKAGRIADRAAVHARRHAAKAWGSMRSSWGQGGARGLLKNNYFAALAALALGIAALGLANPVPGHVVAQGVDLSCNQLMGSRVDLWAIHSYAVTSHHSRTIGGEKWWVVRFSADCEGLVPANQGNRRTLTGSFAATKRDGEWYLEADPARSALELGD